jgi:hypothetical protein
VQQKREKTMKTMSQIFTTTGMKTVQFAGLTVLVLVAGGCGHPASPAGNAGVSFCHVYVGLDTSASWRPFLGVSATLCARQAVRLDPKRDFLTLYRLDSSTREFSNDHAPESGDKLQRVIIREVGSVSTTRGTFPAKFWTAVTTRAKADRGNVVVEVFSDGDNDDQSAQASSDIKAAARRLAANPRVSGVWIFGAEPRNWETLRADFAPLGDRFHLCSPPEMTIDRVASALSGGS